MFFSSEFQLTSVVGLGRLSLLDANELAFVDGDIGSS
jgi:hypothetical protein